MLKKIINRLKKRKAKKEISKVELDQDALDEHKITLDEIAQTKLYVSHLQDDYTGKENNGWYDDVLNGKDKIIRTKYLIHEITEQRALKEKGVDLFKHKPEEARIILEEHRDAHYKALNAEVNYLRKKHPGMRFDKLLKKYFKKDEIAEILTNPL